MSSKVILCFGPPGAGKTTSLSDSARKAVTLRQDRNCMILCSLTNTAAKQLARQDLPVNPEHVGTMHALCYRALGRPELVYNEEHIEAWNTRWPGYALPQVKLHGHSPEQDTAMDRATQTGTIGEEAQALADLHRQRMTPLEAWSWQARDFYDKWTVFKKDQGVMDFSDLIEAGLTMEEPPFGVKLGILDEAADSSKLELTVWHHWTKMMEYSMVAGDDQQAIFGFRGADPLSLVHMDPPPQEIRVLPHSYRLPIKVHAYVERWGEQIQVRYPKFYTPKDEEGKVTTTNATYQQPALLTPLIDAQLAHNKTIMILTACQYQLTPILAFLRARGYAFSNAWRPNHSGWNPLARHKKQVHTADRVAAYMAIVTHGQLLWTAKQLKAWVPLVDANNTFLRGAKAAIAELPNTTDITFDHMRQWFHAEALEHALSGAPDWLLSHAIGTAYKTLQYPITIAQRQPEDLTKQPLITVGTIHSLKGAESCCCIVFPDLSPAGWDEWNGQDRDSVLRQFYVALSRASETLVLGSPASNRAVRWISS